MFIRLTLAIALYAYAFGLIKAVETTPTRNRHDHDGSHDNDPVGKMVGAGQRLGETHPLPSRNNPARSLKKGWQTGSGKHGEVASTIVSR